MSLDFFKFKCLMYFTIKQKHLRIGYSMDANVLEKTLFTSVIKCIFSRV